MNMNKGYAAAANLPPKNAQLPKMSGKTLEQGLTTICGEREGNAPSSIALAKIHIEDLRDDTGHAPKKRRIGPEHDDRRRPR